MKIEIKARYKSMRDNSERMSALRSCQQNSMIVESSAEASNNVKTSWE